MRDPKTNDEKTNQKSFQTTSLIMLLLIIEKIYLYSFIFDLEIYLANQIVLYKKNHPGININCQISLDSFCPVENI